MEVWKDVKGYEGLYQVSSCGRVRSFHSHKNGERIMKQHTDNKGYRRLWLCKDGVQKNYKVHRIVAEAFLANDKNLPQVNHKDENKNNNNVDNLEWCDNQYNSIYNDRMIKISKKLGRRVKCLETGVIYESLKEASRKTGVSHSSIVYCCQGVFKQAKGYHFRYED